MSKKVLFITLHYLNGVGGGVFASRAYINAFAEIFKDITLIYPSKSDKIPDGIAKNIRLIPVENNKSVLGKLIDLILGKVHRNFDIMPNILASEKFDYVVFDNSRVSYRMIKLAHKHGAKVITIHHNYEYEYNRDNTSGIIKSLLLYWIKKYEKQAVIYSDLNLTLTNSDKYLLKNVYAPDTDIQIETIGTFEYSNNTISSHQDSSILEKTTKFVITGDLASKQTEDSVIPWISNYYPILLEEIPNANLTIAGRNPSSVLRNICTRNGIKLIPNPKDMTDIVKGGDCYICPIKLGGGIKLRIMDGLKEGLSVITHSVSARGYENFETKGLLFSYFDIESFRNACEAFVQTRKTKNEIMSEYQHIFSFNSGCKRLKDILKFYKLI